MKKSTNTNILQKKLSKNDLLALKNLLPIGGLTRIGEKTKFSLQYICYVLEGRRRITKTNVCIVNEAVKMVTEIKKVEDQVSIDLKKLLAA